MVEGRSDHLVQFRAIRALMDGLPDRELAPASQALYRACFLRMLDEKNLDPLHPGMARDTYGVRRAALHHGARSLLMTLYRTIERAVEAGDQDELAGAVAAYLAAGRLLQPALDSHPPISQPDFQEPSPWAALEKENRPRRGAASKRHDLPSLARLCPSRDWRDVVWERSSDRSGYREALACLSLAPFRPGEYVPGVRDRLAWPGVWIRALPGERLALFTRPTKTHKGRYGRAVAGIIVDCRQAGPQAAFLAFRCRQKGGEFIVSVRSADAFRKNVERVACEALGDPEVVVTPYTYRHQCLADLKLVFGSGGAVARGAGHCSSKTQSRYAVRHCGRSGRGIVATFGDLSPRLRLLIGEAAHDLLTTGLAPSSAAASIAPAAVREFPEADLSRVEGVSEHAEGGDATDDNADPGFRM